MSPVTSGPAVAVPHGLTEIHDFSDGESLVDGYGSLSAIARGGGAIFTTCSGR